MKDTQINRAEWAHFVDKFSRNNQNRPVSIEVLSQTLGDERLAQNTPLIGLDFDRQGQGKILITVGRGISTMTHAIVAPDTIWLNTGQSGKDLALEITTVDKEQIILSFADIKKGR